MTDVFNGIIGHDKQLNYLQKVLETGSAAQAYCFSGPEQIGKFTIARRFAAALIGIEESRLEAHPDVRLINQESLTKVEDIRDLKELFSMTAIAGGRKIAIINNAHTLNRHGQNALLKMLEEPAGLTSIFLITNRPGQLVSTILSRSAHIKFQLVPISEIKNPMAELCAGRPGLAFKLADDDYHREFLELTEQAKEFLQMPLSGRLTFIDSIIQQKETRSGKIKELIQIWRTIIHNDLSEKPKQSAAALKALQETELALDANSNQSLALQHFALSV